MKNKKIILFLFVLIFLLCTFICTYADSEISEEKALKTAITILKNDFGIELSEKDNPQVTFQKEGEDNKKPIWSIEFSKNSTPIYMEIDAQTGRLLEFEKQENNKNESNEKINKEAAKNTADNFVKKMNPDKIKETRLKIEGDYSFNYRRNANKMDFDDNEIYIKIDPETGKINYYRLKWDDNINYEDVKKITKDAREYAVDNINNHFNIQLDEKCNASLEIEEDRDTKESIYSINFWNIKNKTDEFVDIEVDSKNGTLINFSRFRNNEDKIIERITREQAQKISDKFLKKINPNEFKNLKLNEIETEDEDYRFEYIRTKNNIEFTENGVRVGIDKETGDIVYYNFHWDNDLEFEDKKNIVDKNKALEIIKNNSKLDFYYKGLEQEDNVYGETKLVYHLNTDSVNAINGKLMDAYKEENESKEFKDISREEKEKIFRNSSKIQKLNKEITKDEASKIMKGKLKELLNADVNLEGLSYVENDWPYIIKVKKGWDGNYEVNDSKIDGNIIIDSENKKIIHFSQWQKHKQNKDTNCTITWEQGYDKALEIVKKYYPDKIMNIDTKIEYEKDDEDSDSYQYYFRRVENKLRYAHDMIMIQVNKQTGKIDSFECEWNENTDLPDKSKVISEKEAKEILFNNYYIKLSYETTEENEEKARLVYELVPLKNELYYIDGVSGKLLNYDAEEIE